MFPFLKNHPFAVEAFFKSSTVLTFAFPKHELEQLIPECLVLDTFNDWAFLAVAMVQTKQLRPKGFPKVFGNDFFLIGYRIFVRYTNNAGKRLRGLYILRSETDKKKMVLLGNIFTKYDYTTTDIQQTLKEDRIEIQSTQSGFFVEVETSNGEVSLPENSPFSDWKDARKFAGPLPYTFTFNPENREVLIIEGVRQNWDPTPVKVISHHIPFLYSFNSEHKKLASAFVIRDIPYHWKKGKTEIWQK